MDINTLFAAAAVFFLLAILISGIALVRENRSERARQSDDRVPAVPRQDSLHTS